MNQLTDNIIQINVQASGAIPSDKEIKSLKKFKKEVLSSRSWKITNI